jgi:hypothetical protein
MHTYFGKISKEEFQDLEPSEVFVDKNGDCYWYMAEITENDELVISDTVGRMIPFNLESLEPLLEILESVVAYTDRIETAENLLKQTFNDC